MNKISILICCLISISCSRAKFEAETAPLPEAPVVTYRNPLIANMADPHVIRVDGKYYLYATSHQRGYDVYVSDDLVHWENAGLAFDDPRRGAWAPDVFHFTRGDGKFYLYYTDTDTTLPPGPTHKQIGVAVADSPLGPFVDQGVLITKAIDAHLFQDDDGEFYLYYVSFAGENRMQVQRMADPLTKEGDPVLVIRPTEEWEKISGQVTEAPFMLKRNGIYYLMYSGNGADHYGYGIAYATADSPMGPFVKYAGNPIGKHNETVFGPGHHAVVEGPDGNLWIIYHQKYNRELNYHRFVAVDPMWFDGEGVIHVRLSRDTDERLKHP